MKTLAVAAAAGLSSSTPATHAADRALLLPLTGGVRRALFRHTARNGQRSPSVANTRFCSTRTREQGGEGRLLGGVAMHMAFTSDGSQLVVLFPPGRASGLGVADAQITIRDAATLKPIGLSTAQGLRRRVHRHLLCITSRRTIAPSSPRPRTASVVDLRSRKKTRTEEIETACMRLPSARTVAPRRSGSIVAASTNWSTRRADASGPRRAFSPGPRAGCSSARTPARSYLDGVSTGSGNSRAAVFESATPLETLRGHSRQVQKPVSAPTDRRSTR